MAVDAVGDGGLARVLRGVADKPPVLKLTPEVALGEYLKTFLRLPISPSRLGPTSKVFEYVAAAAPGVREVLVLGKIATEVRDQSWDLVVVDAPATGHAVELLAAADTLSDIIPVGPILAQTSWMSELLADSDISSVLVVTTPEELPVTESLGLLNRLRDETQVDVCGVVCNRMPITLSKRAAKQGRSMDSPLASIALARSKESTRQLDRLTDAAGSATVVLDADADTDAMAAVRSELETVLTSLLKSTQDADEDGAL